jgi:hypothetical protein
MFDSCKVVTKTAASDVCYLSDKNNINLLHLKIFKKIQVVCKFGTSSGF